jgi:hypothetical protein
MSLSLSASWIGSSGTQKRNRSFASQYLSLILIILTMILPLYGRVSLPEQSLNTQHASSLIPEYKKKVWTRALLPNLFAKDSNKPIPERLKVLLTLLRSHPIDFRLTLTGPVSKLPLLLTRLERLEEKLLEDSPYTAQIPVLVGVAEEEAIYGEFAPMETP